MVDKIKWNNGISKPGRCQWILGTSDILLKASQCKLTLSIRNVIIRRWTHSNGKVNGFLWNTWKHTFDGSDICFFTSFSTYFCCSNKIVRWWRVVTYCYDLEHCNLDITSSIYEILRGLILQRSLSSFMDFFVRNIFQKDVKFVGG